MFVPTYDVAVAGYLALAITVPTVIMVAGLFAVGLSGTPLVDVLADFLPSFAIFILAVALGEVVRSRRALAAETARRLELAEEEQRSEAARLLAEERLRIARELHDTVAHSMATITVQAGSALHVLSAAHDGAVREALVNIRETSKSALGEMRAVLGQLREGAGADARGPAAPAAPEGLGLGRLPELRAAVTAAGSPVRVSVEGEPGPLPPEVDHAAYRILQESLTNVLRHAVSGTEAEVSLRYEPDSVTITVANDGCVPGGSLEAGNGLRGMRERATAAGGELAAGPRPEGGFLVTAKLPRQAAPLPERRDAAASGQPQDGGAGVTAGQRIRVLLADDQALLRAGFRMLLAAADDIEVVAEAANGGCGRRPGPRAPPGRGADGPADARRGRAHRDRPDHRRPGAGRGPGRGAHHVRRRRERLRRAAGRRQRLPCQGRRAA